MSFSQDFLELLHLPEPLYLDLSLSSWVTDFQATWWLVTRREYSNTTNLNMAALYHAFVCTVLGMGLVIKASHMARSQGVGEIYIRAVTMVVWFIGEHQYHSPLQLLSGRAKNQIRSAWLRVSNSLSNYKGLDCITIAPKDLPHYLSSSNMYRSSEEMAFELNTGEYVVFHWADKEEESRADPLGRGSMIRQGEEVRNFRL